MATRTKEMATAGPAPGRPKEALWWIRYSRRGAFRMELVSNFCPAIAVPTMVKMPEPMTAPMPREVRLNQPRDFLRRSSAPSQSEISWSIFLRRKRGEATQALRGAHPGAAKNPLPDTKISAWTLYREMTLGARLDGRRKCLCRLELGVAFDEFLGAAS